LKEARGGEVKEQERVTVWCKGEKERGEKEGESEYR
jgi:hypothetical protein